MKPLYKKNVGIMELRSRYKGIKQFFDMVISNNYVCKPMQISFIYISNLVCLFA